MERWWVLCVYVWELVGGGMYIRLWVYVLLFTVALTIWPGFFISFFWGSSLQGLRLDCIAQVYYPYYSPPAVSRSPLRAWWLVYNYISNDVQMLQNECYLYLPNGGAKNNLKY